MVNKRTDTVLNGTHILIEAGKGTDREDVTSERESCSEDALRGNV